MVEKRSPRVLVTRSIPETGLQLLRESCEVDLFSENRVMPRQLLLEKVADMEGLVCLLSDKIDRELLESAPKLKVVSNYAVGYDNIDVEVATSLGVVVTNTPGVLTDATADLAYALLLGASRRIVEADRIMRSEAFAGWSPLFMLGQELKGKTLGILGAGRIGTAVAERSLGWKMRVLYYDRGKNDHLEKTCNAKKVALDDLLRESDFLSIHLPYNEETHHLIDAEKMKRMKKTAVLINTARGPIIDENALVTALREKWITAAGLDVYEKEPEMAPGLADLENATLAPHIGSATTHARNEMSRIAAENLLSVLNGKKPEFTVNPEAGLKD